MFWQDNYSIHDLRQWGEKFNAIVKFKYSGAAQRYNYSSRLLVVPLNWW
jgi:hypothetical protein